MWCSTQTQSKHETARIVDVAQAKRLVFPVWDREELGNLVQAILGSLNQQGACSEPR